MARGRLLQEYGEDGNLLASWVRMIADDEFGNHGSLNDESSEAPRESGDKGLCRMSSNTILICRRY
jgi:hypothetical protein